MKGKADTALVTDLPDTATIQNLLSEDKPLRASKAQMNTGVSLAEAISEASKVSFK